MNAYVKYTKLKYTSNTCEIVYTYTSLKFEFICDMCIFHNWFFEQVAMNACLLTGLNFSCLSHNDCACIFDKTLTYDGLKGALKLTLALSIGIGFNPFESGIGLSPTYSIFYILDSYTILKLFAKSWHHSPIELIKT